MGTTFLQCTNRTNHLSVKKYIACGLYILFPLALLHLCVSPISFHAPPPNTTATVKAVGLTTSEVTGQPPCNYSDGKWVVHSGGPVYDGTSCKTIRKGQNCMEHGRPDTGYLYWRWQPRSCPLPAFDPTAFLDLLAHKHLAFVGDSMARNQLESLLCLLATAEEPELVYRDGEDNKFRRWVFRRRNSTVSVFWSPFLVKGVEKNEPEGMNHNTLFLETADERWAEELDQIDIVLFSMGHWYLHPAIYNENGVVIGCHHCPDLNHTEVGFFDVFRKAVRTTLREVKRHTSGDKLAVVTTFSPAHFEGEWDKAGACPKKEPYKEGEKEMEYMDALMRSIEIEEVAAAAATAEEEDSRGGNVKLEALDVTKMALLRPDGHPGPYMHPHPFSNGAANDRVQNDCVHWCLPGPIDAWNEILLQILRRWKTESKN
ncbi:xyloglucan O-acetyltransferase 1-like [Curcuma longa]|uniref:xyloglucan O-acetyltransferase 1-like n=1 Tax=Curcuma longa TaxID=136217 RepID=UPI003D9DFB9C